MLTFRAGICISLLMILASFPWTISSAAEKPSYSNTKETARTEVWKAITAGKAGSATVAVMENGVAVYAEGFGMTDRQRSIPVDKNTLFNIGSISKVYCATAIMLLVDEGKVNLDKPVTAYLPEFTMADERYRDITVRMLLNHSSGLPGTIVPNISGYAYNKEYNASVLEVLAKSRLKHRPGEMAPYCNDGFTLAEIVVARVSGKSFIEFLSERIFKPLALNKTGPSVGQRRNEKGVSIANFYDTSGLSDPLELFSGLGAGGLSSTAEELCKFADSFSPGGTHILSPVSLVEMEKLQPSEFFDKLRKPTTQFGLGWDFTAVSRFEAQNIKMLGKSGGTNNYTSMLFTVPDKRISVAVMTASSHGASIAIAEAIMEAFLTEKGYFVKAAKTVKPPLAAQQIPENLAEYEGYYSSGGNLMRIAFDRSEKSVKVFRVENRVEVPLNTAIYNDDYFHAADGIYYFASVGNRRYLVNRSALFADNVVCQKLDPVAQPQELRIAVDGKKWLRRDAKAYEARSLAETYVITSLTLRSLPGYIDFLGPKKIETASTAVPAINAMRDLTELVLFDKDGETWSWLTGLLYMPAESARALEVGDIRVSIGKEGYNEWLNLKESAVLGFQIPNQGRILVFDAEGKLLYDSVVDSGDVYAPVGGFVAMAGETGTSLTVRVSYP